MLCSEQPVSDGWARGKGFAPESWGLHRGGCRYDMGGDSSQEGKVKCGIYGDTEVAGGSGRGGRTGMPWVMFGWEDCSPKNPPTFLPSGATASASSSPSLIPCHLHTKPAMPVLWWHRV